MTRTFFFTEHRTRGPNVESPTTCYTFRLTLARLLLSSDHAIRPYDFNRGNVNYMVHVMYGLYYSTAVPSHQLSVSPSNIENNNTMTSDLPVSSAIRANPVHAIAFLPPPPSTYLNSTSLRPPFLATEEELNTQARQNAFSTILV